MYISNLLTLSSLSALAIAQTTYSMQSSTSSSCAAQPVLDSCYASTTAIIQTCGTTDYGCLCQKYNDLITCFNVCPNDARLAAAQSSKSTYCADAAIYTSSTTAAVSRSVSGTGVSTATTTDASGAAATTGASGAIRVSGTATNSAASASQTAKSGAEGRVVGAGSLVLGFAGLVGAFL